MVLESQESKVRYQGNDLATEWPVPFPVLREEHLHLIVTDTNGKDTPINSNYEITGIREETVSVTYPVEGEPLSSAHRITIYREVPLVQQLDLENGGNFNAEVVERQLDNTVMQIQQIQEQIDRSIKVSISSEEIPKTAEDIYEQVNLIADRAKGAVTQAENAVNSAQEQAELATSAANDAYSSNCTAKAWAALAYGEPVEFDLETDEALFSARHYRDEASEIAMGNIPNASPAERGLVPHTENGKAGWVYQITENGTSYEFAPQTEPEVPLATSTSPGISQPDNETITVSDGILSIKASSPYTTNITTSGSWTAPASGLYLVEVLGGGGAGGGHYRSATSGGCAGGGGGSGVYKTFVKYYAKDDIVSAIVGAGGSTITGQGTGGDGGETSFDNVKSRGGQGGNGLVNSAVGVFYLQPGANSVGGGSIGGDNSSIGRVTVAGIVTAAIGGKGGNSPYGNGGGRSSSSQMDTGNSPGFDAGGYGAGGGGGASVNTTAYGGSGSPGLIVITYIGR